MYSPYDDPDFKPAPGFAERQRLQQLKHELRMHTQEVARLEDEIKRLESLPYVLDTPLPLY